MAAGVGRCSPHPRKQPVPDPFRVLPVAGQFGLQSLVFPACPQNQQGRRQDRRNQRPYGTQAQGGPHAKKDTADVTGVTHNGVGSSIDNFLATIRAAGSPCLLPFLHRCLTPLSATSCHIELWQAPAVVRSTMALLVLRVTHCRARHQCGLAETEQAATRMPARSGGHAVVGRASTPHGPAVVASVTGPDGEHARGGQTRPAGRERSCGLASALSQWVKRIEDRCFGLPIFDISAKANCC
jgi:hypothetical protein